MRGSVYVGRCVCVRVCMEPCVNVCVARCLCGYKCVCQCGFWGAFKHGSLCAKGVHVILYMYFHPFGSKLCVHECTCMCLCTYTCICA